jgi:hypothetical protein
MTFAKLRRDPSCRFADRLNQMNEGEPKILVRVVLRAGHSLRLADGLLAMSSMCPT